MDHTAAVRDLETEFADAMQRMYAVGNGLARLRADLARTEAVATAPPAAPSMVPPVGSAPGRGPAAAVPPAAVPPVLSPGVARTDVPTGRPGSSVPPTGTPAAPLAPPPVPWWRREGAVTRVLALAGAVVTLAGVAMLLVIAAQQGWFGPQVRVAAGAALAATLVLLGVRGGERDRAVGAVGSAPVALVATGAAAAYLDVVAVTVGYGWLPAVWGLALGVGVAMAGLFLARRWDSQLLAVVLLLGAAVLAPVVAQDAGWVVSAFLAVLCLTGWYAAAGRGSLVLTLARTGPVTLSLLAGADSAATGSADAWGLVVVALVLVAATVVTSALAVRRHPSDVPASVAVALLVVGLLATTSALPRDPATLVLALTAAALLVAAATLSRPPAGPLAGHLLWAIGGAGTVTAVLAVTSGTPERFTATGLLVLALGQLTVAGVTRSGRSLALAGASSLVALGAWAEHPLAMVTRNGALGHDTAAALLDSLLAAGLVGTALWATSTVRGLSRDVRLAVVVAAWVVGLAASTTAVVSAGTLVGSAVGAPDLGFTAGQALATLAWMGAATWLLLHAFGSSRMAELRLRSGLLLAGLSVAKLFLYDLAALSGVVRSVAFIATGLLLLATGSRYARAHEQARATG